MNEEKETIPGKVATIGTGRSPLSNIPDTPEFREETLTKVCELILRESNIKVADMFQEISKVKNKESHLSAHQRKVMLSIGDMWDKYREDGDKLTKEQFNMMIGRLAFSASLKSMKRMMV